MSSGKPPYTPEEALARIRDIAENGTITFAPEDEVQRLQPQIDLILQAMGRAVGGPMADRIQTAWVSDRSAVSDFCPRDMSRGEWLEAVGRELGLRLESGNTGLVDIAKRLLA